MSTAHASSVSPLSIETRFLTSVHILLGMFSNSKCNLCVLNADGLVPNKPHICPIPWKGLNGICDRRGDMCKNNADCGEDGEKCCFNGCQKDCVKFGKSLPRCH